MEKAKMWAMYHSFRKRFEENPLDTSNAMALSHMVRRLERLSREEEEQDAKDTIHIKVE